MDHPYSFWADLLSKFQGATPWIQALWLVLVAAVAMNLVWCLADVLRHAVAAARRPKQDARLVYGLVQDSEGRWLVCIDGEASPADALDGGLRSVAALDLSRRADTQRLLLPRGEA